MTPVESPIHGQLRPVLRPGSEEGFEDATVPPAGDGYVYLAQGENFDCGMGSLGLTSAEIPRSNPDALACTGHSFTDVFASSETPISGTVTGSLTDLSSSDNVYETIEEVKIGGISQLEHHWSFTVPGGSGLVKVHREGFGIPSAEEEAIRLEWSTDGGASFKPLNAFFGTAQADADGSTAIPPMSGALVIRLIYTVRANGTGQLDAVTLDQMWVRAVP